MNNRLPEDLENRILLMLDGELDAKGIAQLDIELQSNKQARELYLQTAALHSALQNHHQSRSNMPLMPVIPMKRLLAQHRRKQVRISLMAAAALMLITAVTLWLINAPRHDSLASFLVTQDASFTLTHSENGKESSPDGNTLRTGSRLQISHGTTEIAFKSGVRCIAKAPSDILVLADDRISMSQGEAWFEVPPAAIGFTIETPKLNIVDLGTKFGVLAPADGEHEVHVVKGKVEINALGRDKKSDKLILTAGMARKVDDDGNLLETAYDSDRFQKTLPNSLIIRNPGFDSLENYSADHDIRGYGPIASWATSGLGIGISNEAQPFLEQPPHSGTHTAFIQGKGQISQTISGFDPSKLYTVTYFIGERGLPGAATSTSVSLDLGTTSYTVPDNIKKTDNFRRIVSGPLAVFGPSANIQISASPVSGDCSLLIDSVSISRAVPTIPDGGFENPVQGKGIFKQPVAGNGSLVGSNWTFKNGGGITGNHSPFLPPLAPEGSQAAILQNQGASFSTLVNGFESDVTYTISFDAAARKDGASSFQVKLGDKTISFNNVQTITPKDLNYTTFTSDTFIASQNSLSLSFESTGEGTSFIDDLRFNFVAEAPNPAD